MDQSDALVGAERDHLPFLLAVEEVVVVLHADEAGPAVPVGEVERLGELPRVHRRRAQVAGLARLDDVVQRLERLLDRCVAVPPVNLQQVDVVQSQPAERVVDLGEDRLPGQSPAVGPGTRLAVDLGGDDRRLAVGEVAQRPAQDLLTRSVGVDVGGVEEVDARVDRTLDQRACLVLGEDPRVTAATGVAEAHHAETDGGDLQAGAPKPPVLQVSHWFRPFDGRCLSAALSLASRSSGLDRSRTVESAIGPLR